MPVNLAEFHENRALADSDDGFLNSFFNDLRFGLRTIRKNPGFSTMVVVTLALAIGANTAIFSAVYGVLLRPLPYRGGNELVVLHQESTYGHLSDVRFSVPEIVDYRNYNHTLNDIAEYHSMDFLLLGNETAERVKTGVVSANFFDTLGVTPILGRTFIPEDESPNANAVIILSYRYWRDHLGADPKVVGRIFQMNDRTHIVIGVLPPIPQYPSENDIYVPTSACPTRSSAMARTRRDMRMMTVFGRIKNGALSAAQADLSTAASQIAKSNPDSYPAEYGYAISATPLNEDLTHRAHRTLIVLLCAAGFVLFIACANVANLLLARFFKRRQEFSVRSALGASRVRLVLQLLTETGLLCLAGAALGLVIAYSALPLLVNYIGRYTTRSAEIRIDTTILGFAILIAVVCCVLIGLVPALSVSRNTGDALKQGSMQTTGNIGQRTLRGTFVFVQVMVSFVLLAGAGLMIRSVIRLQNVDPGFSTDRILTLFLTPNYSRYPMNQRSARLLELGDEVLRRVQSISGVESAGLTSTFPMSEVAMANGPDHIALEIRGRVVTKSEMQSFTDLTAVSPSYFETIRQPLAQGRLFTEHDDEMASRVAIINETMSRHYWSLRDPSGQMISLDQGKTWMRIVGVVGDAREYGLDHATGDEVYVPLKQVGFSGGLVVRTAVDPTGMIALLQKNVREVDSQIAIDRVETLERLRDRSITPSRMTALLLSQFAVLALVMSSAGIAGVMSLSVNYRTRELGIRMALGQPKMSLLYMVVRQGLILTVAATTFGILGAMGVGRLLSSLLFQTSPTDPATLSTISIIFVLVAILACVVPAHRVTLIDPSSVLREG